MGFLPIYARVYLYFLAALLGLVLGSALNCLSYRIAHGQKWSGKSRSVCPVCGHVLGAKDLVPLFSYLFLKGKCRYCGTKISPRYPLTEAMLAVCYMSILARFGLTLDALSWAVFCSCLFCLSLVDLETRMIPDRFLVIPAVFRILQLLLEGGLKGLLSGIWPGLAMGGAVLVLTLIMDKILKKETMGGGDIKLLAVVGMFLPFSQCLLMLILACVVGILMAAILMKAKPDAAFPFGPAISLSAWITMLAGEAIVSWYWSLFL